MCQEISLVYLKIDFAPNLVESILGNDTLNSKLKPFKSHTIYYWRHDKLLSKG